MTNSCNWIQYLKVLKSNIATYASYYLRKIAWVLKPTDLGVNPSLTPTIWPLTNY